MSKIFEALTRGGQGMIADLALEPLLEGQVVPTEAPLSQPAPAEMQPDKTRVLVDAGILSGVRVVPFRVVPTAPILPFDGSHWRAGEQYRILRTKLVQHPRQPRMIVVTSACPSDGKSVTVINLAGALALKSESRVLLLDGDFRRSTVAKQVGLANEPGLAQVLRGECSLAEATIQAEQIPNLYVLPAGCSSSNPTELLDSSTWAELCAGLRSQFKYIVVDSPPMAAVADYDLIQAACDGVVLVLRPDRTDRQLCLNTLQAVPKDKLLGVVLNCVDEWFLDRNHYPPYYYSNNNQRHQ